MDTNTTYVAVLAGGAHSKKASSDAQAKAELIQKSSGLDNVRIVNTIDGDDQAGGDSEVAYLWQCGFIQGDTAFDSACRAGKQFAGKHHDCRPTERPEVRHKPQDLHRVYRCIRFVRPNPLLGACHTSYIDAKPEDRPGAMVVGGVYRKEGDNWTVNLVIRKGAQRLQQAVTAGQDVLAAKLLSAIQSAAEGFNH